MAFAQLVDSIRSLIVSHAQGDESSFVRHAQSIVRALQTQNRTGEAKALREALKPLQKATGTKAPPESLEVLAKQAEGLITFSVPKSPKQMIYSPDSEKTLGEILGEVRNATKLAEAGLSPRNRILFWGPPGCGKTAAASWLAQELDLPCAHVCLGRLITSFVGETGANVAKVLRSAEETPMVLLIDEADAIAKSREDRNDVGELRRVVNSLLQALDGFSGRDSIVILASNHSEIFDEALWRRFDAIVEFPMPTQDQRLQLIKGLTNGMATKGNLTELAKKMSGLSYAEIERAVLDVARGMVVNNRKSVTTQEIAGAAAEWKRRKRAAGRRRTPLPDES